jgi:hypothetical protein
MKQITSILLLFALSLPLILLGQGYHRSAKVGVTLSPNPASVHGGSVCIEINAGQDSSYQKTPVTIQLYNLIGKQVGASITGHHISNNGCEIELTLPPGTIPGVYFVTVILPNKKEQTVRRLILN